jgi:GTPase SAR1 family protein
VQVALDRLEEHVAAGARDVLLLGPTGVGKTLLLRRLAAGLFRPGRVFYCPFLHFEPQEATRWLLNLVGLPTDAGEERLVPELMRGGRPWAPNLLLLDEAQAIPEDTLRHLAALLRRGDWGLSRVWAGIDGSALYRIPKVVDTDMPRVPLIYRHDESEPRPSLKAIARDLSLSSWQRRTVRIPAPQRPRSVDEAPREPRQVPDRRVPPPGPATQGVPSNPPAVRHPVEPEAEAGRASLGARPSSPQPAASAVASRLRRPGHLMSTWRRAWIAASAAVAVGVVTGLFSILSRTIESTDAVALPAAMEAPVLVDINAVPWAHIVVDGREMGATPIGNLSLAPGSHRIQARFGHGDFAERTVEVSDENRRIGFRGAPAGRIGQ